MVKDFIGNELKVGDQITYASYQGRPHLKRAVITKLEGTALRTTSGGKKPHLGVQMDDIIVYPHILKVSS